jgi:hypothetical protein
MGGLIDYFPARVWVVMGALAVMAVVPFFLSPSLRFAAGLTLEQYILAVGFLELAAAVGVAAIVIHHHDFDREPEKWQYDP